MLRPTTSSDLPYIERFDELAKLVTSEYDLPQDVAEAIAQDVLIASLRHAPENPSEWLAGAMLYAVQSHLRTLHE